LKGQSKEMRQRQKRDKETLIFFHEGSNMVEEQVSLPSITLGDYAMHQGLRRFSSIAIPSTTRALGMKPVFLSLIDRQGIQKKGLLELNTTKVFFGSKQNFDATD